MIVYEVNLRVESGIARDYAHWLEAHIAQMLALPGFVSAERFEVEAADDATHRGFCVQYRLADAGALDAYLREHAPQMRADALARFGERFSATRRILRPLAVQ